MFDGLISLVYPSICMACGESLYKGEDILCTHCRYHLPKTNFHQDKDNPVIRHFWGKVNVHSAASYYFFNKGEKVQSLMHHFKYKGRKEIGLFLGEVYGTELNEAPLFNAIDVIIPVPLHRNKKLKRGYNQSELFAEGLAKSMNKQFDHKTLYRAKASETQTKKSRFQRWENVNEIFKLNDVEKLQGKHILLVDDVITTGSTLEACAEVLLQIPDIKISVVTIAYAHN